MKTMMLVAGLAVVLVAGCQTGIPGVSSRIMPADEQLVEEVRYRLANDPVVAQSQVVVSIEKGVVTLRGRVPLAVHGRAMAIVRSTPGVRDVKDQLENR